MTTPKLTPKSHTWARTLPAEPKHCAHENLTKGVVGGMHACNECGHRVTCAHTEHGGPRALDEDEKAYLGTLALGTLALEVTDEDLVACDECGGFLWGQHRHVLQLDHGPPHYVTCEGCGTELAAIRQLPQGRSIDSPSGLHCENCATARRDAVGIEESSALTAKSET